MLNSSDLVAKSGTNSLNTDDRHLLVTINSEPVVSLSCSAMQLEQVLELVALEREISNTTRKVK